MNSLNIYQRINAVMKEAEYMQKGAAQQGKGVLYDDVIAMLRPLLIKHGIVIVVRQMSFESVSSVEGTKQKIYQGRYDMDLVNIDKPEDKVTHTAYAQGMDGGDKAPGKAQTYAVKIMLTKGFALESGVDEESRSEKINNKNVINEDEINTLYKLLCDNTGHYTPKGLKICQAFKFTNLNEIPKSKYEAIIQKAR